MIRDSDLDTVMSRRKQFIGGYLVEHAAGAGFERIFDVGKIVRVARVDEVFTITTDSRVSCRLLETGPRAVRVRTDDDKIYLTDPRGNISYTLVPQSAPGGEFVHA